MLFSIIISPVFATEINNPATCDSGTLSTDTGPTNLRANYESNTLNLKWYDDDYNRINVSSTSSDSCTYGGTINLPTPPEKRGYTFKGWKVLPYNQIEYIEATGTQWIDTGIKRSIVGVTIDTNVFVTDWSGEHAFVGIKEDCAGFELYTAGRQISLYNASGCLARATGLNPDTIHNVVAGLMYNKILLTIDGIDYSANVAPRYLYDGTFTLFNLCNSYNAKVKMYYFKLYGDGTLLRDMIPVKDSNGVACMYDKVTGNFFYNAGTGNFIAGPDL